MKKYLPDIGWTSADVVKTQNIFLTWKRVGPLWGYGVAKKYISKQNQKYAQK